MTFFKKNDAKASTQNAATAGTANIRTISALELVAISGGINPQPLPPGRRITL